MARSSHETAVRVPPHAPDLESLLLIGPFHAALRAAIRERGLTLERLCWHLAQRGIRIGLSTLSLWQHGHSRPERASSLRAVQGLEEILGLAPRSLLRLLAAGEPAGQRAGSATSRRVHHEGLDERDGPLAELLDRLPGSRDRSMEVLSLHQTLVLDSERRTRLIRSRTVLRACRNGVDRHVMRYFGGPECDVERVRVRPGANCRLGQVWRHRSMPVMVAELLFGQALHAGDTWAFEDDLLEDATGACTEMAHAFRYPEAQCLLEVRFHPAAVPAGCHAYARSGLYTERQRICDLSLTTHGTVHLAATDVRTGVLGIGWDWS
jgi:hypothetical protein